MKTNRRDQHRSFTLHGVNCSKNITESNQSIHLIRKKRVIRCWWNDELDELNSILKFTLDNKLEDTFKASGWMSLNEYNKSSLPLHTLQYILRVFETHALLPRSQIHEFCHIVPLIWIIHCAITSISTCPRFEHFQQSRFCPPKIKSNLRRIRFRNLRIILFIERVEHMERIPKVKQICCWERVIMWILITKNLHILCYLYRNGGKYKHRLNNEDGNVISLYLLCPKSSVGK